MNDNPYILDQTDTYDIEGTVGNVTFALSTIQHTLDTEGGEPLELTYEVAQGSILAIAGMIRSLNESVERVELLRNELTAQLNAPEKAA